MVLYRKAKLLPEEKTAVLVAGLTKREQWGVRRTDEAHSGSAGKAVKRKTGSSPRVGVVYGQAHPTEHSAVIKCVMTFLRLKSLRHRQRHR